MKHLTLEQKCDLVSKMPLASIFEQEQFHVNKVSKLPLHSLNAIVPKKTSFNDYSDQDIKEIQQKLNRRPRKKLNFQIPLKLFFSDFT